MNNNFAHFQQQQQQQQQQLRMLQQQQQQQQSAGDWRGAISEKDRLPIIEKLTSIMIGSPYGHGKTRMELFQKMKELEGIEFQKAPTREMYLAQMTLMIKNAEFKKSTISTPGQPRPMMPAGNQPLNATMMQSFIQSQQSNLINAQMAQQGQFGMAQGMQPILPSTFNPNNQVAALLTQTIGLYQSVGASLKQKNPMVEQKLKEFEASRPKSQYEKKLLTPNEKVVVNSILNMLKRLYPSLDALAYYMFLNRNNHEESLIKLLGIKSIMAEQFALAPQDIFYFNPHICTQLVGALREMINSWIDFQRKVANDNRQAGLGVLGGNVGLTPQMQDSSLTQPNPETTSNTPVTDVRQDLPSINDILKRDFACNPQLTTEGIKLMEPLLLPNFPIPEDPKPRPPIVIDIEQQARDLFGPCVLVDVDFESKENTSAQKDMIAKGGYTVGQEIKLLETSSSVSCEQQLFGQHLTLTFTSGSQVLILSIPNVENYEKGDRTIYCDLAVGIDEEKVQLLNQLLTQTPSVHSCVELIFTAIS